VDLCSGRPLDFRRETGACIPMEPQIALTGMRKCQGVQGGRLALRAARIVIAKSVSPLRSDPRAVAIRICAGCRRETSPFNAKICYFPRPMPESLSMAGLRATPLLMLAFVGAEPVVVPGFMLEFMLEFVAPGLTLPWLDAPGAGCVCADAIAVAPNSVVATRAESASLDRMGISSLYSDAKVKTCGLGLGSG
jgi:hypothetical protein